MYEAPINHFPPIFETLCRGADLSLCGWMLGWGGPKVQIGVLHPQCLQEFDKRPENRSVLSLPSHDSHGQRAALQPRQDNTCLEGTAQMFVQMSDRHGLKIPRQQRARNTCPLLEFLSDVPLISSMTSPGQMNLSKSAWLPGVRSRTKTRPLRYLRRKMLKSECCAACFTKTCKT